MLIKPAQLKNKLRLINSFMSVISSVIRLGYKILAKPILFQIDPEKIHDQALMIGQWFSKKSWRQKFLAALFLYKNDSLKQTIVGLNFSNPIGLAAGFDKNGLIVKVMEPLGFGYTEVGSITGRPCAGNAKPRLWRFPKSKSIAVYYGLANQGANKVVERLNKEKIKIPLGVSIAKTNDHLTDDPEEAIKDYLIAWHEAIKVASFITINISCPNTSGGQPFTDPILLERLLSAIGQENSQMPIFIKLSPDLTDNQVDNLLAVISRHRISGLICSNLTHDKKHLTKDEQSIQSKGGISGKGLDKEADKLLSTIYQKTKGRYILIGCGGIFSAKDAYQKIKLGASLVQLITGMIFEGPQLISELNQDLAKLLKQDGYKNISEAVGADNK